jgi:hypothetical protein
VNEPTALTRWLTALGRIAATSWPTAPCSFGALLVRRGAGRAAPSARP